MSTILKSYKNLFQPSRPVYKLHSDGGQVRAMLLQEADQGIKKDDVIHVLLNSKYGETFNHRTHTMHVEFDGMVSQAAATIHDKVRDFYAINSDLKKPKTSNTYKWLDYCGTGNDVLNDSFVMLYRYARSFCGHDMDARGLSGTEDHVNNFYEIIELMRKKYE